LAALQRKLEGKAYFMADNWHLLEGISDSRLNNGCQCVGGFSVNRNIYNIYLKRSFRNLRRACNFSFMAIMPICSQMQLFWSLTILERREMPISAFRAFCAVEFQNSVIVDKQAPK
jgi:hypothetical protein